MHATGCLGHRPCFRPDLTDATAARCMFALFLFQELTRFHNAEYINFLEKVQPGPARGGVQVMSARLYREEDGCSRVNIDRISAFCRRGCNR